MTLLAPNVKVHLALGFIDKGQIEVVSSDLWALSQFFAFGRGSNKIAGGSP